MQLQEKLSKLPSLHSECCIYRIPYKFKRSSGEEAFTPKMVSIGPYHRNKHNIRLRSMEEQKLLYVESFLCRADEPMKRQDYMEAIKGWEMTLRNCYDERIELESEEFNNMMLIDGIFMIQLFLLYHDPHLINGCDFILGKKQIIDTVRCDLILLENQLPFDLIQGLYNMSTFSSGSPDLMELVCNFFRPIMGSREVEYSNTTTVRHFLDAIRISYSLPPLGNNNNNNNGVDHYETIDHIPSVKELHSVGVQLICGKSDHLLEIKLIPGLLMLLLEIPVFILTPMTLPIFTNMVAFEQQHYPEDTYITAYVTFLDHLINTPQDVEKLVGCGVIRNFIGSNEAAVKVFNSFCKEDFVLTKNAYFLKQRHNLTTHCRRLSNPITGKILRTLSTPWGPIYAMEAVLVLILTIVQIVCSFLTLPPKNNH